MYDRCILTAWSVSTLGLLTGMQDLLKAQCPGSTPTFNCSHTRPCNDENDQGTAREHDALTLKTLAEDIYRYKQLVAV